MRKYTILILLLIVTCGFFSSCKKTEVVAPATSTTYVIASNGWSYDATYDYWYVVINDPSITSDIVNTGSVNVFDQNGGISSALPYTQYDNLNNLSYSFYYNYSAGQVEIDYQANTSVATPGISGSYSFKVVVIPGQ